VKTTTRIKKINGHEYLYEITYYYDKETRRTRQKSRYLGKNIGGEPVRVREKAKTPEKVYAYGEFIPYLHAIKSLRLQEILSAHLTDHEVRLFVTLLLAGIHHPDALHSPASWYEGTILSHIFSGLKVTTQNISKLLKKLGEGSLHLSICRSLSQTPKSDSMRINLMHIPMNQHNSWHCANFHEGIEPIALFYDAIENIPVGYLSSAPYLITSDLIKAIHAGMHLFSGKKGIIISGKPFTSAMNLYGAIFSEIPVIFPLDPNHDIIKGEIKKVRSELMHPRNLKIFRGETPLCHPRYNSPSDCSGKRNISSTVHAKRKKHENDLVRISISSLRISMKNQYINGYSLQRLSLMLLDDMNHFSSGEWRITDFSWR
jgi:hypothetical protein